MNKKKNNREFKEDKVVHQICLANHQIYFILGRFVTL